MSMRINSEQTSWTDDIIPDVPVSARRGVLFITLNFEVVSEVTCREDSRTRSTELHIFNLKARLRLVELIVQQEAGRLSSLSSEARVRRELTKEEKRKEKMEEKMGPGGTRQCHAMLCEVELQTIRFEFVQSLRTVLRSSGLDSPPASASVLCSTHRNDPSIKLEIIIIILSTSFSESCEETVEHEMKVGLMFLGLLFEYYLFERDNGR
ncbi:hypothetical protein BJ165DRAFT_1411063 [Panaeolus papilionaceus]|nr:hypothetical protein BJ165DRAFT_1411063 [Panaeolus papilionaceus]